MSGQASNFSHLVILPLVMFTTTLIHLQHPASATESTRADNLMKLRAYCGGVTSNSLDYDKVCQCFADSLVDHVPDELVDRYFSIYQDGEGNNKHQISDSEAKIAIVAHQLCSWEGDQNMKVQAETDLKKMLDVYDKKPNLAQVDDLHREENSPCHERSFMHLYHFDQNIWKISSLDVVATFGKHAQCYLNITLQDKISKCHEDYRDRLERLSHFSNSQRILDSLDVLSKDSALRNIFAYYNVSMLNDSPSFELLDWQRSSENRETLSQQLSLPDRSYISTGSTYDRLVLDTIAPLGDVKHGEIAISHVGLVYASYCLRLLQSDDSFEKNVE